MGNENSTGSNKGNHIDPDVEASIRREERIYYEKKCQELLELQKKHLEEQKQDVLNKAKEKLEEEKRAYERIYKGLVDKNKQTVQPNQPSTQDSLKKESEAHQRTTTIYPHLPNYDLASTSSSCGGTAPPTWPINHFTERSQRNCSSCRKDLKDCAIFMCCSRHPCCLGCKQHLVPCGVCGYAITEYRNIDLEAYLAQINLQQNTPILKQNCPNLMDGCILTFYPRDLAAHEKECPFNEMPCPVNKYSRCAWRGKINQLKIHFKEDHPENCVADVDKEMKVSNINEDSYNMYLVVLGNFHFLVHIRVDTQQKLVKMTAQFIGTNISANKWSYQFHVYNTTTPRRKYQYNAVCHTNMTPLQEIFDKCDCAAITATHARSFVKNDSLTYKFYLKKQAKKVGEWRRKTIPKGEEKRI